MPLPVSLDSTDRTTADANLVGATLAIGRIMDLQMRRFFSLLLATLAIHVAVCADEPAATTPTSVADSARRKVQVAQLLEIRNEQEEIYAVISSDDVSDAERFRRLDTLRRRYENLCEEFPEFVEAKILYAAFLKDGGEDKAAQKMLEESIKALEAGRNSKPESEKPSEPAPADMLDPAPLLAVAHRELAEIFAERGDLKSAVSHFDSAIEFAPGNALTQLRMAEFLLEFRGRILDEKICIEKFPNAEALDTQMQDAFRASLAVEPRFETAWRYGLSFLLVERPDWSAALRAWDLAKRIAESAKNNMSAEEQKTLFAALELQRARAFAELGELQSAEAALANAAEVPELSRSREEVQRLIVKKRIATSKSEVKAEE